MTQTVFSKVRMGMVGGGEGAFIGEVHRQAAQLDGQIELVCGAFSSDAERSRRCGAALGLSADRSYADFHSMMQAEAALPAADRMQFVAVVTPNHLHAPVAEAALQHGFHVLMDKPATLTLAEALALRERVASSGLLFGLTHTYTGYPLVKEARERIAQGALGKIRKVLVEYTQGWLATEPDADNKQAAWRLDPQRAGASCCMGDIGVHAANLVEYVTRLKILEVCADLTSFVSGRVLDDDGSMLLRLSDDARGVLTASQVCVGEENGLRIKVFGEQGGLEWAQQEPNTLWLKWPDRPTEMLRTGGAYLGAAAQTNTRTPMGHPEGYIEAFANIYRGFAGAVVAHGTGVAAMTAMQAADVPDIDVAVRGMAFIEQAVAASASEQKWLTLETK